MPEMASLGLLLGALAPHLKLKNLTMQALEEAILWAGPVERRAFLDDARDAANSGAGSLFSMPRLPSASPESGGRLPPSQSSENAAGLMAAVLSRLLIRENTIRDALGKGECGV